MKRCVVWLCVIVIGLAGGCSKEESRTSTPEAPAKVRLALNWVPEPEFGGIYAAREIGAFAKRGIEVEILGGGAGAPVVQMVAGGQADFGIASADEVVMARSRGIDVVAIFATFQTCPQGIMVHASKGLKNIGEVFASGMTVAMEPGLPYAVHLKRRFGFEKVKVVPYDGGVARFVADPNFTQQCFITSEPIAARKQGADPQVFLVAEAGYNPYTAVVITRGEYLRTRPKLVAAAAMALREGWRAYLDNPRPANAVMAKLNPSMDGDTFIAAAEAQKPLIESDATGKGHLGAMTRDRWQSLIEQLAELKLIDRRPSPEECFVNPTGN